MDYLLPSTVYQPPPRQARGRHLNTIMEDNEDTMNALTKRGERNTRMASPVTLDAKHFRPAPQQPRHRTTYRRGPPSTVSSEADDDDVVVPSSRSSCASSDAGTVFSDSCPSLTGSHASSDATSFTTDSCRSSMASQNHRMSRNRYPTLLIPRGSLELEMQIKELSTLVMSPSTKVRLSPEALDRLPRHYPSADAPPSLGDASSVRSESPYRRALNSIPSTPDIHSINTEDQPWGTQHPMALNTPLEIALDDEESILLSAEEAHSAHHSAASYRSSHNWNELVHQFPLIPGATPVELTPVTPIIPRAENFECLLDEAGVELPERALEMLQTLNRGAYTASLTGSSVSGREEEEMQECAVPDSRPQSWSLATPSSDYSISQLSVPSPGGFFSSLKSGARHTWCMPNRKTSSPPPPSSTTAENFYSVPWNKPSLVKETVIEYDGATDDDGPPTVRQAMFHPSISSPDEDEDDMYGSGKARQVNFEYEEEYEEGIKQAAGVNLDRTSDWLTAQDTYIVTRCGTTEPTESTPPAASPVPPAVPTKALPEPPKTASPVKETLFLEAFAHHKSEAKRSDVFLQALPRLDTIESTRTALPERHVRSLLNSYNSKSLEPEHARPKYRGPFSQNPRNTGDFSQSFEQAQFKTIEREQTALKAIQPSLWVLEAQRNILYSGRLTANRRVSERLTQRGSETDAGTHKRRAKILDLAGAPTASWAWAAAAQWPEATVYTVQSKQQAELAEKYTPQSDDDGFGTPETPVNHKVLSVPQLWQLPFPDNYFDIVSARTLHMYLRAQPVSGVDSMDEWDLTLKECMRVLRAGGVLDFFVLDSGVSNDCSQSNSLAAINLSPSNMMSSNTTTLPKRPEVTTEFKNELLHRGYEVDGGCGRLMSRLKQEGFMGVKRQWIALPLGHPDDAAYADDFRPAPRPLSEASTISKILNPFAGVEAIQGPVGSTSSMSPVSALLGESLWEEWLVRLRLESGKYTAENVLNGVDEQFSEWRQSGKAALRGVVGWASKPGKKKSLPQEKPQVCTETLATLTSAPATVETFPIASPWFHPAATTGPTGIQRQASVRGARPPVKGLASSGLRIKTDFSAATRRPVRGADWSYRANEVRSIDFTMSAVDRGEVGEIPMMIIG